MAHSVAPRVAAVPATPVASSSSSSGRVVRSTGIGRRKTSSSAPSSSSRLRASSSSASTPSTSASGIEGDVYVVSEEQIATFERDGYVHIPNVLTEEEMAEVEEPMGKFLRGEVLPTGKDLCDMSGATDREPDEFTVFNAMLPRRYLPSMQGNLFERRAASIAEQLQRGRRREKATNGGERPYHARCFSSFQIK